jgi:ketosteroid isomerase-like protein
MRKKAARAYTREMSRENVEQHYRAADAFSDHDLDGFLAITDPGIELISRHLALDGSAHLRGHAAVRRWWETLLSVYPDFTSEVEDVRDLGDVTIGRQHFRGQGIGSGAEMEQESWQVTQWRDSKAVWWRSCLTEADALSEAAGLQE